MAKRVKKLVIRVSEKQSKMLQAIADKNDTTVSAVVRAIIFNTRSAA